MGFGDGVIAVSQLVTNYLDPWFGGSTVVAGIVEVALIMPRAGTLRNLYVRQNGPSGIGSSVITYTVYVNGVATALAVSMLETASSGSDLLHTAVVNVGDRVAMVVTKSLAISAGTLIPVATMECV